MQSSFNELLTNLRELEAPAQTRVAGVTALFVGDYKADHPNHELTSCTLAVAYNKPSPTDTQPGGLLLLVGSRSRTPVHMLPQP